MNFALISIAVGLCASLTVIPVTAQRLDTPPTTSKPQAQNAAQSAIQAQTITLAGLNERVQILIDRWGVPHIYAANQDDVFFAQGFNAARDRLFQIDLWRRRGLGRLAAVFGSAFVEQDKATRHFLYRGDMQKEWRAYGKNAERIATQFVAGVNAYIDFIGSDPKKMPFEFSYFGYTPEKWQPDDVVRIRSHGLTRNLQSEVARATVTCRADLKSDEFRVPLSPRWETKLPEGLDPCLPRDLLRTFNLATQGVIVAGRSPAGSRAALVPHPAPHTTTHIKKTQNEGTKYETRNTRNTRNYTNEHGYSGDRLRPEDRI